VTPINDGRGERGFSMVAAIIVLLVASLLLFAAVDAVTGDNLPTRTTLDQNRALLAAEAGLASFRQQLTLNPSYWNECPGVNGSTGVTGTTGWASVAQSSDTGSGESYSYHIVPSSTTTSSDPYCDTKSPTTTVIEGNSSASGSFRVEVSGTSRGVSRSIVGQFRPQSFLNYVYFTNYEVTDPLVVETGSQCYNDFGGSKMVYFWQSQGQQRNNECGPIQFVTGDQINGPLHTNDEIDVCGSPVFGRAGHQPPDAVELGGTASTGAVYSPCGGANPTYNTATGSYVQTGTLPVPSDDSSMLAVADGGNASLTNGCSTVGAGCVFTGPTTISLNGNNVTVQNALYNNGNATVLPNGYPSNGVIYVQNNTAQGSCPAYNNTSPSYPGASAGPCGDATVSGSYTRSLTIAAVNDVIINGNLTTTMSSNYEPTGNVFLGLVADDFVRVAHTAGYGGIQLNNLQIDAAILALQHSFIVDDYSDGSPLGTLTVDGSIAQDYRGPVGTGNGTQVSTGYLKNYNYDQALQTESPPYFPAPTGTPWELVRVTECDTSC